MARITTSNGQIVNIIESKNELLAMVDSGHYHIFFPVHHPNDPKKEILLNINNVTWIESD